MFPEKGKEVFILTIVSDAHTRYNKRKIHNMKFSSVL